MDTKTIEQDLRDALRANDGTRKRTLRMVLAAVKMVQVEKQSPVDEAGLMAILQKEIKLRREAVSEAQKANRADLVAASEAEIAVLEAYLPKPLSQEELVALAQSIIAEIGATAPADMGKVMKVLVARLQGRAPGDQASQVVRQLLQKA
ncbi:MAG TPA: GatB/YqeY domain-containing protein [Anaerolineaceae bacterium]|jgi:uncharacterized protein